METDSPDPDDRWDRASTSTSYDIEGFEISKKYYDLSTDFEPEFNVDYHLLYAVYSSGDSFGHDVGYDIEFLGLYEKKETADLNLKRITDRKKEDEEPTTLLTDFGMCYEFYIPWFGYFESLDYITIETIRRTGK